MTGTSRNTRGQRDNGRSSNARPEPVASLDVDEGASPPYDLDSEKVVLGAMLLSPAAIDAVIETKLTSSAFYNPKHALVYATITAAHALGEPTGPYGIATRLKESGEIARIGGAGYLSELTTAGETAGKLSWFVNSLVSKATQRQGLIDSARLSAAIRSGDSSRIAAVLAELHRSLIAEPAVDAPGVKPINWAELWNRDFDDIDWLVEPIVERGQSVSLVAAAKTGKSLLILECAAALASGRSVLGNPPAAPMRVLYVDQENTEQDVYRRLAAMGYKPEDLTNLVYLSFANLPPLNTAEGSAALLAQVDKHSAEIVILDTISRMVVGEENSSDTWLELYRHTLVQLKARRISVIRLDHHGKDTERGARGSSAKQGDIDAEWELTASSSERLRLRRTLSRGSNGEGVVELIRHQRPLLRHEAVGVAQATAADIENAISHLDGEGAPLDISKRKAAELLRSVGVAMGNSKILEALHVRRERAEKRSHQDQDHPTSGPDLQAGPQDQDHRGISPAQCGPGPLQDHQDHQPPSQAGGWSQWSPHVSGDHPAAPGPRAGEDAPLDRWPTVPPPPSGRIHTEPETGRWLISGRQADHKEAS